MQSIDAQTMNSTTDEAPEWHTLDPEQVLERLDADAHAGLDESLAAERLARYGANEIPSGERRSLAAIVATQFADLMIVILAAAALISGLLGEIADTLTIITIILINAAIGASQEFRAQRAVAALRRMSVPVARVLRSGALVRIGSDRIVPGDIVEITAGDIAPADLRLLESDELTLDESALTGESLPVSKNTGTLDGRDIVVGDRTNMIFKSTAVTKGRGRGVVVATGLASEIGRIADLLVHSQDLRTPLQQRLAVFARRLAAIVIVICAAVFGLGIAAGEPPILMFLTAVSLAVAAVPEALPAVVTISLALGARRLSHGRSLVRRLPAVETLGSVTYICTDKTGTLTENRMEVAAVVAGGQTRDRLDELAPALRDALGACFALCNEVRDTDFGDPTELALIRAADKAGYSAADLLDRYRLVRVFAFDSDRKMMSSVHRDGDATVVFAKGAPEPLIERCEHVLGADGSAVPIDKPQQVELADRLAREGYRVLALATRREPAEFDAAAADQAESHLTLLGLVALSDPIRPEVPDAIADCRRAGITPVMITGDHPVTARQIAAELELGTGDQTVSGTELAAMSELQLRERARHTRVYARVDPEQKIRIVEALQANGEHVAMTGDGVNDAPALKQASIGIAMGQRGTDVARESADIVLLDDNFATIVTAVREGRRVYDNIRKFIRYTMTSNTGEIFVLLLAPLLGLPIPLLPIHILWVNLVTDGLPGLAFSAEPAEPGVMSRAPRSPKENLFARGMWLQVLVFGLILGALSLATTLRTDPANTLHWQTMVFSTLVIAQLFQALALRSETASLLSLGLFSNRFMIVTVAATLLSQLLVVYLPIFNRLLHTTPLPAEDFALCVALGFAMLPIVELRKLVARRMG